MKSYRIPNRKGPRVKKGQFSKMVVTKELYRRFIKKFPEYKGMTWGEFFKNWQEIAETIRIETVTNPLGVKLGSYNGELKMQYSPYKVETTDYKASEEMGRRVPYLNIMSKGKNPTIKWERRYAVSFNPMLQFFAFMETREMTKLKKDYILSNPEKIRVSRVVSGGKGGHNYWKQQKLK